MNTLSRVLTAAAFLTLPCATLAGQPRTGSRKDPDSLVFRPAGPRAEIAVVDGNPQSDGNFAIALRFQAGGIILPHFHPNETRVVVVRGQAYIGFGDMSDTLHTPPLGPGGYAVIPAGAHHFEAGKTDALIIVYGAGPLKTTMVGGGAGHP